MNELLSEPATKFVPTKSDSDPRKIAPVRAVMGLA